MTGFILKLIAAASMLADHMNKLIIIPFGLADKIGINILGHSIGLPFLLGLFGRLSFPIFAFLISEGARHTSDIKKYICRIMIFAVISEIPFSLAFSPGNALQGQNVMFTFLIALCAIYISGKSTEKILIPAAALAAMLAAKLLRTDYGAYGVLLVLIFYYFEKKLSIPLFAAAVIAYYGRRISTGSVSYILEAASVIMAAVPVLLYSGKRGPRLKWLFYIFYPAHISVLLILRIMMLT
ncbi:MAG: hypothetical protein J6N52_15120 [Clostridia bacterium]|nr:hypothetical protein [Clostridia bacterium]